MGTTLGWRWVIPEVFGVHRGFCLRLYWLFRYHWCWHVLTTCLWWYHREWAPRNDFGRWFSRGGPQLWRCQLRQEIGEVKSMLRWKQCHLPVVTPCGVQHFNFSDDDDDPGWWWCCCCWWSNYIIVFFRWFSSCLIYSILFGTFPDGTGKSSIYFDGIFQPSQAYKYRGFSSHVWGQRRVFPQEIWHLGQAFPFSEPVTDILQRRSADRSPCGGLFLRATNRETDDEPTILWFYGDIMGYNMYNIIISYEI